MAAEELAVLREAITMLGKFVAEHRALITTLEELGATGWQTRLHELRETPEYQLIAKRYELAALQYEVDADFEALARLLQQSDEGKPPN